MWIISLGLNPLLWRVGLYLNVVTALNYHIVQWLSRSINGTSRRCCFPSLLHLRALQSAKEDQFLLLGFFIFTKNGFDCYVLLSNAVIPFHWWNKIEPDCSQCSETVQFIYLDKEQLWWFAIKKNNKKKKTSRFVSSILIFITSHLIPRKVAPSQSANSFAATLLYWVERRRRATFPNEVKSLPTGIRLRMDRTWWMRWNKKGAEWWNGDAAQRPWWITSCGFCFLYKLSVFWLPPLWSYNTPGMTSLPTYTNSKSQWLSCLRWATLLSPLPWLVTSHRPTTVQGRYCAAVVLLLNVRKEEQRF